MIEPPDWSRAGLGRCTCGLSGGCDGVGADAYPCNQPAMVKSAARIAELEQAARAASDDFEAIKAASAHPVSWALMVDLDFTHSDEKSGPIDQFVATRSGA